MRNATSLLKSVRNIAESGKVMNDHRHRVERMLIGAIGEWEHATYDIAITPDGKIA